jgi:uncharacterized surface protein with fasciclin (FAS1) repeats
MNTIRSTALALAAATLVPLAACSDEASDAAAPSEPSTKTLTEALGSASDLATVANALRDTGLASVFEGPGSYTVLAPSDDAFAALGTDRQLLEDDAQRAAVVAILRDHILPGFLLPSDITKAIDASAAGQVEMTTMANHTLTFSKSGEDVVVTNEDGASARLSGSPVTANNGVAIPIDGVLKAKATE